MNLARLSSSPAQLATAMVNLEATRAASEAERTAATRAFIRGILERAEEHRRRAVFTRPRPLPINGREYARRRRHR